MRATTPPPWSPSIQTLWRSGAARTACPNSDYATLAADPSVQEYVHSCVDELNGRLNRWETIKDFRILDHDLSIEADELTPSMKVKRSVAEARHQRLIDEMYADPARR